MRRDPDFFGEQELELIYIARRLKEALALEDLFTRQGVDYLVEPDHYQGGVLFKTARIGAFFYVAPGTESSARAVLTNNGYKPYAEE